MNHLRNFRGLGLLDPQSLRDIPVSPLVNRTEELLVRDILFRGVESLRIKLVNSDFRFGVFDETHGTEGLFVFVSLGRILGTNSWCGTDPFVTIELLIDDLAVVSIGRNVVMTSTLFL